MKNKYIPPKSYLYEMSFQENIADSQAGGGDQLTGTFTILFSQAISPCRDYFTDAVRNPLGNNATFIEYFMEMQKLGAPAGCLSLI